LSAEGNEIGFARNVSDRFIFMERSTVVEQNTPEKLLKNTDEGKS